MLVACALLHWFGLATAVAAAAGGEADVCLQAKGSLDKRADDLLRPAVFLATALAMGGVRGRVGAEPDDLVVVQIGHAPVFMEMGPCRRTSRSGGGTRA